MLVAGIADNDIRKEVLSWKDLDAKTDKELVTFVEEKEIAKNDMGWYHSKCSRVVGI